MGILIGTVIILLCLVLCVPVHYSIEAKRTEGEGNPPVEVETKATWLFHFINMRICYSTNLKVRLRVLFLTIFRIPSKAKRTDGKKGRNKKSWKNKKSLNGESIKGKTKEYKTKEYKNKVDKHKYGEPKDSEYSNGEPGYIKSESVDYISQHFAEKTDAEETEGANTESGRMADIEAAENMEGAKSSLKDKLFKIYDFFKNIRYTINEICDKIKGIFENIQHYLDIIKSEEFKASFLACKDELFSVFSYIRPRKINAKFVVGTGDPASTGQALAYFYGFVYPLLGPDISLEGDFDNKRMEGFVMLKGRVKLFTFIKAVIRIYFNKDIKALLKLFNKED